MGKRSEFPRIPKDAYMTTDIRAVAPILNFYRNTPVKYYEPCAGNGDLIKLLDAFECVGRSDSDIDARTTQYETSADFFITNPPWSRELLHPIIENLRKQKPTWLLFDSDWMFTAQSHEYMQYCRMVIPIGRLKWIPNSGNTGKDNCAWYLFVARKTYCTFIPKSKRMK